jgi:hypothetical protein
VLRNGTERRQCRRRDRCININKMKRRVAHHRGVGRVIDDASRVRATPERR